MTMWKQITNRPDAIVNERVIDSEKLLSMMAQLHFLKQAGEDIVLHEEVDAHYHVTAYIVERKHPARFGERPIITRFEKL